MSKNSPDSRSGLHRMLLKRLVIVTVVIGIVVSSIVLVTQRDEVARVGFEQFRQGVDLFSWHINENLNGDFTNPDVMQRQLDKIITVRKERAAGTITAVRMLDNTNRTVASFDDGDYQYAKQVKEWLDEVADDTASNQEAYEIRRIEGRPHVKLVVALYSNKLTTVGSVQGMLVVSDSAIANARFKILRSILIVVAIVIAIAALFYPVIINLLHKLSALSVDLLDANIEIIGTLGSAIAKKDSDTDAHNFRVTLMSVKLAEVIGLSDSKIRSLIKGAFLHDVGKIAIPDAVLLKPGKLDEEEFSVMKTHVEHGLDIISRSKWLHDAKDVVGGHHEKYAGHGYPEDLSDEKVPALARVFAIVDVFDALTCRRPYKEPIPYARTMEILEEGRGNHFHPEFLDVFFGISQELYANIATREDPALRDELDDIIKQYFHANIAEYI